MTPKRTIARLVIGGGRLCCCGGRRCSLAEVADDVEGVEGAAGAVADQHVDDHRRHEADEAEARRQEAVSRNAGETSPPRPIATSPATAATSPSPSSRGVKLVSKVTLTMTWPTKAARSRPEARERHEEGPPLEPDGQEVAATKRRPATHGDDERVAVEAIELGSDGHGGTPSAGGEPQLSPSSLPEKLRNCMPPALPRVSIGRPSPSSARPRRRPGCGTSWPS